MELDLGNVTDIEPLERGESGRIYLPWIKGTKRVLLLARKLEIRRALSDPHLYHQPFIVEKDDDVKEGIPGSFRLMGAGWGHGVDYADRAAVMSEKGFS
ncbi:MAG: hypothetical protein IPG53_15685 [Ignavibacteriales bacterium]|nr:hypothetical protein [Ignavibacteriales bacterium]